MRLRVAMNVALQKIVNLLKTFGFCSSVFGSVCVFNVWPKTTLLLPVWPRATKSLDAPGHGRLPGAANENINEVYGGFAHLYVCL